VKIASWIKWFINEEKILERMDTETAFKTLELEQGDYAGVDKAYKKMAMKYHPDRGGDIEKMKLINLAKDTLGSGSGSGGVRKDWRDFRRGETKQERTEINNKRMAKAKVVTDYIYKNINPLVEKFTPLLQKHLEENTGKTFELKTKTLKADNTENSNLRYNLNKFNGHVSWWLSFESNDSDGLTKYVIEMGATIDENTFEKALSVEGLDVNINFDTFAYSNGKKTKMQQKSWGNRTNTASLGKPEDFFPAKKLAKMGSTEKTRLTKRADALAFIKTELKAINPFTDRDIMLVPIGGETFVKMRRMVWMRQASWSFDDIVEKTSAYSYDSWLRKGKSFYKMMTGKDSLSGQGDGNGATTIMEQTPEFGKIVKEVINLIKKEKYRDAGDLLKAKGEEFDKEILPKIKAKILK
jgi:hypothetical protein